MQRVILLHIVQASKQLCAGLTACQLHRHTALQARHRHRLVAIATHSRQSKMAPDLRTPGAAENQVPYFVDGKLSLWSSVVCFISISADYKVYRGIVSVNK